LADLRGQVEQQPGDACGEQERQPAGAVIESVRTHEFTSDSLWRPTVTTAEAPAGLRYSRASRRASELDDHSSARNSSRVAEPSSANMCSTTPTSRSLWNGSSTCSCETRFTDVRWHAGQRTASPRAPSPGASTKKDDGKTGRGRSSG